MTIYCIHIEGRQSIEIDLHTDTPIRLIIDDLVKDQGLASRSPDNILYSYVLRAGSEQRPLSRELTLQQAAYGNGGDLHLVAQEDAGWTNLVTPPTVPIGSKLIANPGSKPGSKLISKPIPRSGSRIGGKLISKLISKPISKPGRRPSGNKRRGATLLRTVAVVIGSMLVVLAFVWVLMSILFTDVPANISTGGEQPSSKHMRLPGDIAPALDPTSALITATPIPPTPPPAPTAPPPPTASIGAPAPLPPTPTTQAPPTAPIGAPPPLPPAPTTQAPPTAPIGAPDPLPPAPTTSAPPTAPPQLVTVPLVGTYEGEVYAILEAAGLGANVVRRGSGCEPYRVIEQEPAPGAQVQPGSVVTVYVCPPVSVPNVLGSDKDAAAAELRAAGLVPSLAPGNRDSDPAKDNRVWAIEPGPGSEVAPGTVVTIFWSYYRERDAGGANGADDGD